MPETDEKKLDLSAIADPLGKLRERISEAREYFPSGSGLNHLTGAIEDLERNGAQLKPMEVDRRFGRVVMDTRQVMADLICHLTRDPSAHYPLKIDEPRLRALVNIGDACADLARQLPNDPKGMMNRAAKAFSEKVRVGNNGYASVRNAWSAFGAAFDKLSEWIANNESMAEMPEAK